MRMRLRMHSSSEGFGTFIGLSLRCVPGMPLQTQHERLTSAFAAHRSILFYSKGWMFLPITDYHAGGDDATFGAYPEAYVSSTVLAILVGCSGGEAPCHCPLKTAACVPMIIPTDVSACLACWGRRQVRMGSGAIPWGGCRCMLQRRQTVRVARGQGNLDEVSVAHACRSSNLNVVLERTLIGKDTGRTTLPVPQHPIQRHRMLRCKLKFR